MLGTSGPQSVDMRSNLWVYQINILKPIFIFIFKSIKPYQCLIYMTDCPGLYA